MINFVSSMHESENSAFSLFVFSFNTEACRSHPTRRRRYLRRFPYVALKVTFGRLLPPVR